MSNLDPLFMWPDILYHPNIPKPLHGLSPRAVLGQEWWDIQRRKAYEKNNFCCWACGIHKTEANYYHWLEAHECYKIDYHKGVMEMKLITALCHTCHNYIHNGRLMMQVNKGEASQNFYNDVLEYGNSILSRRIDKTLPYELIFLTFTLESLGSVTSKKQTSAKWENWRLIIGKKEFKPLHKSFEEWKEFYSGQE